MPLAQVHGLGLSDSSPVQGFDQHHLHQKPLPPSPTSATSTAVNHNKNNSPGGSPSTSNPTTTTYTGHAPTNNNKILPQSPLRQSGLYKHHEEEEDSDSQDLPTPQSFRGVIDFANSKIGRAKMSFTGDKRGGRPRRSDASEIYTDISSMRAATETPTPTNPSPVTTTTGSSRFAMFASSMFKTGANPMPSSPTSLSIPQNDKLMNLDIQTALFPRGSEGETFSPAAYKNLQQIATGLLEQFQTAYQQRTIAYHELKAERSAASEEKEESETRMHHLKLQLEDMARKAAEQEDMMRSLVEELNRERKLSARMLEEHHNRRSNTSTAAPSISEGSSVSEDLGAEEDQQRRRRKWRRSGGTVKSDVGFDTDDESIEEASVFSRSRSPTISTSLTDGGVATPSSVNILAEYPLPITQLRAPVSVAPRDKRLPQLPVAQPQMNTFQKLFKGIAGEAEVKGPASCRNCEGQDASVAWDTVNLLKDENKGLKERVGELEGAMEGALDAVNGVGF